MIENEILKSARKASEKDPVTNIEAGEVRALTDADIEACYINNGKVLAESIDQIGMGRYQWQLFCTCGFGFAVDQVGPLSSYFKDNSLSPSRFYLSRSPSLCLRSRKNCRHNIQLWSRLLYTWVCLSALSSVVL